jgi:hypothetical protein
MMSLIHWFSAERRLEACERTIIALGGSRFSDKDVPSQLAAQRDMIKFEIKYYKEQAGIFVAVILFVFLLAAVIFVPLHKFGVL